MNEKPATSRLYSVEDAASLLGSISPSTVRKHIANGVIKVTRIGRRVFLPAEQIERIREEGLPSLRVEAKANPDFWDQSNSTKEKKDDA